MCGSVYGLKNKDLRRGRGKKERERKREGGTRKKTAVMKGIHNLLWKKQFEIQERGGAKACSIPPPSHNNHHTHTQLVGGLVNDANHSILGVALTGSLTRKAAFPRLQHDAVVSVYLIAKVKTMQLSVPLSASSCLSGNNSKEEIWLR